MTPNNWKSYWDKQNIEFDNVMNVTTKYFIDKMEIENQIKEYDIYLDFGCGQGYLVNHLKKKCKEVIGIDTSSFYTNYCINKFKDSKNISIFKILDNKELELIIATKKVNNIIILSVIQYFTTIEELTEFLDIIRNICTKYNIEIRLLIADIIPNNHKNILEIFEVFYKSIRHQFFISLIQFLTQYLKEISFKKGFHKLKVDFIFFKNYTQHYNLKLEKLEKLTIHSWRYSVRIYFTPHMNCN